jgi:hypothetical protein
VFVYEPGATKILSFLQQLPKKGAASVTECKMRSANQKKNDASNYGINIYISGKLSNKVPIMIFQMLLAGIDEPIIIEHFLQNVFDGKSLVREASGDSLINTKKKLFYLSP